MTENTQTRRGCKGTLEQFSRVCGFFRPLKAWNPGKVSEHSDKKVYKIGGEDEKETDRQES